MKKCAIYCRVSTIDKQDYQRQVTELTEQAEEHGYSDIDVFAEKISGYVKDEDRPEIKRLLDTIEKSPTLYSTVYILEISRLGRSGKIIRNIIDKLKENKVPLYIKNLKLSTLDSTGKEDIGTNLMIAIFSEIADEYARTFKANSISGMLQSARNGKAGGSNNFPYGYMKDERGMLVVNPDEAIVIKQIFNTYKSGQGTKAIANILNQQGTPTRANKLHGSKEINFQHVTKTADKIKFSEKQIHCILTNPIYKGQRRFKGELLNIEPITTPELFAECNDLLQGKTTRNYVKKYTYLLQDICTCGHCDRNYYGVYKPIQGGQKTYVCSSWLSDTKCDNSGINIPLIESAIYNELLSTDEILKYISNTSDLKNSLIADISNLEQQQPQILKEIASKTKSQAILLDVFIGGDLSKGNFIKKNEEITGLINNLSTKKDLIDAELNKKKSALKNLNSNNTTKKMLVDSASNRVQLQGIFKQLISNVSISGTKDDCIATIRFKIGGVISNGVVRLLLDKKSINKANKVYRYKAYFVTNIDDVDVEVDDEFEKLDWIVIPNENILKVTNGQHG